MFGLTVPNQIRLLRRLYLASIVLFTIGGLTFGLLAGNVAGNDGFTSTIMFLVLLLISVVGIATARFVVLPELFGGSPRYGVALLQTPEATALSAAILGNSFCVSIAIYGLVISIYTGQGLLALPFGVMSLASFFVVSNYVDESIEEARLLKADAQQLTADG